MLQQPDELAAAAVTVSCGEPFNHPLSQPLEPSAAIVSACIDIERVQRSYMNIERETERERRGRKKRDLHLDIKVLVCVCVYIYTYMYVLKVLVSQ